MDQKILLDKIKKNTYSIGNPSFKVKDIMGKEKDKGRKTEKKKPKQSLKEKRKKKKEKKDSSSGQIE